jgi:hypothetical protein
MIDVTPYKINIAPFIDEAKNEERKFEVGSSPYPGFGTNLNSTPESGMTQESAQKALGMVPDPLKAQDQRKNMTKLFQPLRDSFTPNLRSLSTVGIEALGGGGDDTAMRNALRKVLRSIKV